MSEGATVRSGDDAPEVPRFRVAVTAGPDAGATATARDGRMTVGTAEGVALRLTDPTVSRYHVELVAVKGGIRLRDLGSTNGTLLGRTLLQEAVVRDAVDLTLGRTRVTLSLGEERERLPTHTHPSFGALLGRSAAMRAVFAVLERAAGTTTPVLITGESGTGKELAARAVHGASPRASAPLEVVDCGGMPATLIESELFGHEKGAFTGAVGAREGAFERADGGTLFLDELGELPLELQPKLLRALGEGEVRRLGGARPRKVDVRVVAATNRDLRREVNAGRFRADLFYRLAVVQVHMPALRERPEDVPLLAISLIEKIKRERGLPADANLDAEALAALGTQSWPGNVRELRNHLEQHLVLAGAAQAVSPSSPPPHASRDGIFDGLDRMPLRIAKAELIERFERAYVTSLLEQTGWNVAEAARRAGIDRVTMFRTISRYGVRREG
ncbi:MAG: sigma 54-interacting transcriptional regulator [Polyangiales bacterium]